jgi:hypothetical protein
MMNQKDEQLKYFQNLVENSLFNHREKIIEGLKNGSLILEDKSENETHSQSLLEIYQHRAIGLAQRKKGVHAERLVKDTLAFCENLAKLPDEKVRFWHLKIDNVWGYTVFEGVESKSVLGCIFTADRRFVSEEEWNEIWNKK